MSHLPRVYSGILGVGGFLRVYTPIKNPVSHPYKRLRLKKFFAKYKKAMRRGEKVNTADFDSAMCRFESCRRSQKEVS